MTESEEMYLITIAQLSEDGMAGPIPLSRLAEELSVLPVSVNQMIHKMDETGMVRYSPYKGVELTPKGRQIAARMLRLRRLWEVFLVEKLGLSFEEADDLACRMEHITSDDVAGRLSIFLRNPVISPHGRPIPQVDGEAWAAPPQPLDNLKVGQSGVVVSLEADDATGAFLSGEGVRPGVEVFILGISDSGARLVQAGEKQVSLANTVAEKIMVRN
ncbi:MAG: metal-dependent transcriptional regulator [Chloroflexi bacterium]|nr:metal-dependent transcriptional regulator [Chloroflexota bacterium]